MDIIVIIGVLAFLVIAFLFINEVVTTIEEVSSEAKVNPNLKINPDFKPPATKPPTTGSNAISKKVGDLEPNLCPNCGASFNPNTLHCEYCDTWFREKKKPIAMEVDNGVVYVDSENKVSIRSGMGNTVLVEYL